MSIQKTAYNSLVGLLHTCWDCKRQLDTLDLHIRICTECKRRKNTENIKRWRAKQKVKEAQA